MKTIINFILIIALGFVSLAWYDNPKLVEVFVNTKIQPLLSKATEILGTENIFQPQLPKEYTVKEMTVNNEIIYIPYYKNKMIFISNNSIYLADQHSTEVKAFSSRLEALSICNQHYYAHNK